MYVQISYMLYSQVQGRPSSIGLWRQKKILATQVFVKYIFFQSAFHKTRNWIDLEIKHIYITYECDVFMNTMLKEENTMLNNTSNCLWGCGVLMCHNSSKLEDPETKFLVGVAYF